MNFRLNQLLGRWAAIALLVFISSISLRADWPTYQHDAARSGSTVEEAPSDPGLAWSYRSPVRPIPAWDEPALWDGWSKTHDLKNRQVFDKVFHVVEANGRVYFGSSVDEQVHCLDAKTGAEQWTFFTEGPVRLAPTISGDRLYVGSDDGFVYCLQADSGELIWKRSPGPQTRRVAGNGRVISPWAIRTSVVVQGDTVFCGAGVIPSEGVYVVAMHAETGEEIWKSEMKDLPAQGYLLASKTRLYVVTSRDTPIVLDAKTGKRLYKVKGGAGGTYALLTGDTLLFGPSKTGDVNMIGTKQDVLASFQGNHMIVAQPLSYLQSKDELSSLDRGTYVRLFGERKQLAAKKAATESQLKKARADKQSDQAEKLTAEVAELAKQFKQLGDDLKACLKWRTPCQCPYSLVLAGGKLIAGGDGEVIAVNAADGNQLWRREVPGKAYGLAVSNGQLFVSTDEGVVVCLADGIATPSTPGTARPVRHQSYAGPIASPEQIPTEILGPFAEFVGPNKLKIEWDSTIPTSSLVRFGVDMTSAREVGSEALTTEHSLVVDQVQPEVIYRFQVGGQTEDGREIVTEAYRFDSHLNYLPMHPNNAELPQQRRPHEKYDTTAQRMISYLNQAEFGGIEQPSFAGQQTRGYALVAGAVDGRLAWQLAKHSELKVIVVEQNPERVQQIRALFKDTGWYGTRIVVHQQDLSRTTYGPFLANLITSETATYTGKLPHPVATLYKSLRPAGGTMFLHYMGGHTDDFPALPSIVEWKQQLGETLTWNYLDAAGGGGLGSYAHRRGRLPETGEWSHQYGTADNSACSKDDLIRGQMMVQWWGRPGARPMPDRGNRNPPPVSANGRLYVQGNRTLFGLDAYNGTVLWAKQIPTMRRANMPRDGSNMVAADKHVCVAIQGNCVAFDGQSGERLRNFSIPEELALPEHNWGYVSRIESQLFGSAVRPGSQYLGDKGEWFEKFDEGHTAKVTSDAFFAINAYSGETDWVFSGGTIINSTITIADGRVYFIESRNEATRDAKSGRFSKEIQEFQFLVALDAVTGELVWEKPYDFSKCQSVVYMTHANDTLLITGTDPKNTFHTYAFDANNGDDLWQHLAPMKKGHHTGHLAHPTIVGQLVYFNKHTYDLRTGSVLGVHNFDWHGCGVMSASNHTVFSRYEYHGMLDLDTNKRTEFLGIRSGCWLSLIPSGGLLLAPETSAGCSCGHSIQTSIAYVPQSLVPQDLVKAEANKP